MPATERYRSTPQVLHDIDRTLIDSHQGAESALWALAQVVEWPFETIKELRDQYLISLNPLGSIKFNPRGFIEFICEAVFPHYKEMDKKRKFHQLLRVYLDPDHFRSAAYPEVPLVLQELQNSCELGTFSEGVWFWQVFKLQCANLLTYFPHGSLRHILPNKRLPDVIRKLPEDAIITDDNLVVIALLQAAQHAGQPLHPVWVNRTGAVTPDWLTGPQIATYEELPARICQIQQESRATTTVHMNV